MVPEKVISSKGAESAHQPNMKSGVNGSGIEYGTCIFLKIRPPLEIKIKLRCDDVIAFAKAATDITGCWISRITRSCITWIILIVSIFQSEICIFPDIYIIKNAI